MNYPIHTQDDYVIDSLTGIRIGIDLLNHPEPTPDIPQQDEFIECLDCGSNQTPQEGHVCVSCGSYDFY